MLSSDSAEAELASIWTTLRLLAFFLERIVLLSAMRNLNHS